MKIEERNRMDLVGFCPQDLRMTAGGDMFLCQPFFYLSLKTSLTRDTIKGILLVKGGAADDDIYEEWH